MGDQEKNIVQQDEIDLVELAKVIWSRRAFIFKVTAVFAALGIGIALLSKEEFEARSVLIPEAVESEQGLGNLGSLAGLAGIDLAANNASFLTPDLYPEIVGSLPFQLELINQSIRFEKIDSTISSYIFFKEIDTPSGLEIIAEYTIGLPAKLRSLIKGSGNTSSTSRADNMIRISSSDEKLLKSFEDRLEISMNTENGLITIKAEMPDAYAAADLVNLLTEKLTQRVTEYKIQKVKDNLKFTSESYFEAEKRYKEAQKRLAKFTNSNRNISSSLVEIEYERLQNELNLTFEIFKTLAKQLEQDKITVKQKTPVFTVLEPVKIPNEKSKPRRILIVFLCTLIGFFLTIIYQIISSLYSIFIEKKDE